MSIHSPLPARLAYTRISSETPLVSIVIPTYRRDDMLGDALSSALQQDTEAPIEIIVVDNDPGSTAAILTKLDITATRHQLRYYVNDTNLGMFGNWNQGVALARGHWITMLHDDDWLSPRFVTAMLPLSQSGIDFAVCRVAIGNSAFDPAVLRRSRDNARVSPITIDDLIFGNPSPAPGVLVNRRTLINVDGFDAKTYPAGDYLTYATCASTVRSARMNSTLAYYRTTDSQTFKGNTLRSMIEQSISIKQRLLEQATPASTITYILSMAFWFRLARLYAKPVGGLELDWRLKCASVLSRTRVITRVMEAVREALKRLTRENIRL